MVRRADVYLASRRTGQKLTNHFRIIKIDQFLGNIIYAVPVTGAQYR